MGKKKHPPPAVMIEVDERWMREWITFGFGQLDSYLAAHAQFAAYIERREHEQQA